MLYMLIIKKNTCTIKSFMYLNNYYRQSTYLFFRVFFSSVYAMFFYMIIYREKKQGKSIMDKLRWTTLGYHHNWDTKVKTFTLHVPYFH